MVSDVPAADWPTHPGLEFQSALRFAVVSDLTHRWPTAVWKEFQSALRFAVVSDGTGLLGEGRKSLEFQSALRFAVVSDE